MKDHIKIKLTLNAVGHLEVPVEIDGIHTLFLIDTGAGNTVIDIHFARKNLMEFESIDMVGGGVGTSTLGIFHRKVEMFKIGKVEIKPFDLYAADFSHVKKTLEDKGIAEPAVGVLGADILIEYGAIINYRGSFMYLRKPG